MNTRPAAAPAPAAFPTSVRRTAAVASGRARDGLGKAQALPEPDRRLAPRRLLNMPAFARTKIQPPRVRAAALIARPALEARFGQALLEHKLVLVCAPAGFGKSSLLARQMQQLSAGTAVAWIGCDADDSPVQLLECLFAALDPYDLPWRTDPDALIASAARADSRLQRRALVAELINALDACDVPHGLIVVDDLHRVQRGMVFQFLELLLERLTPRWTLVIASREEPPLPLARLRAAGELAEFSAADLRFDADESRELAARAGLDSAEADALHLRTEGWPVGLRLALDLQRGGGPRVSGGGPAHAAMAHDRRVFEFMATEVLDRLRPELREFLLACSVLPELTATRCAAVTGDEAAAQRLDAIDRAGLFVTPLDAPEPAWRLHDLFRAALQQRLRNERPAAVPQLLARAAAGEPDPARRIGLLQQAQDWAAAAVELRAQSPALVTSGAIDVVLHLLQRFPIAEQNDRPELLITLALSGWARWDWPLMLQAAQRAAQACRRNGRSHDALEADGYALVAMRGGGLRSAAPQAAQALAAALAGELGGLPWRNGPVDGNQPGYVAHGLLALDGTWGAFDEGRLHELPSRLQAQMELLEHGSGSDSLYRSLPLPWYLGLDGMGPPVLQYAQNVLARTGGVPGELRSLARALRGGVRLWAGDIAAAMPDLLEAADDTRWRDHPLRLTMYAKTPLHLAHLLLGDQDALQREAAHFQTLLARVEQQPALSHRVIFELYTLARWLLCAGCTAQAQPLLRVLHERHDDRERPVLARQRAALPGYLALLDGNEAAALAVFEPLLADPWLDLYGLRSELRLRVAHLRLARGEVAAAAAALAPLFTRHAGGADIAVVWAPGPALLQRLAGAPWHDTLGDDEQNTLADWARRARGWRDGMPEQVVEPVATRAGVPHSIVVTRSESPGSPASTAAAAAQAVRPAASALSLREREVLARLAAGDSNKLIARALDLSPHTVKRHVANILDKLALSSRGQAAAWHRMHG